MHTVKAASAPKVDHEIISEPTVVISRTSEACAAAVAGLKVGHKGSCSASATQARAAVRRYASDRLAFRMNAAATQVAPRTI